MLKKDSDVTIVNGPVYMIAQCFGALAGAALSQGFGSYYDTAPLINPGTDLYIFKQFAG